MTVDGPMPLSKALENAEDLYYKGAVRIQSDPKLLIYRCRSMDITSYH